MCIRAYRGHLALKHVLMVSGHSVDSCAVTRPNIYIRHRYSYSSSLSNKNMLRLTLGHKMRRLKTQSNFMSGHFLPAEIASTTTSDAGPVPL